MRRMSGGGAGGGGQIFSIGKSKAKLFDQKTDIKITFKDVAGLEGAINFLKHDMVCMSKAFEQPTKQCSNENYYHNELSGLTQRFCNLECSIRENESARFVQPHDAPLEKLATPAESSCGKAGNITHASAEVAFLLDKLSDVLDNLSDKLDKQPQTIQQPTEGGDSRFPC